VDHQAEVAEILARILRTGLLRIRALGAQGMSERCSLEADHLHNLPLLACEPRLDLLSYYYNVERVAFVAKADGCEEFSSDWDRLGAILKALAISSVATRTEK
jgi:hypothetical protein